MGFRAYDSKGVDKNGAKCNMGWVVCVCVLVCVCCVCVCVCWCVCVVCVWCVVQMTALPPSTEPPSARPPSSGPPKFSFFFSLSRSHLVLFFLSLGVFSCLFFSLWGSSCGILLVFWWSWPTLAKPTLAKPTLANVLTDFGQTDFGQFQCFSGLAKCRVKPRRLCGRRGFTQQPENSKRAHWRVPTLQTPPKFHEKTRQQVVHCRISGRTVAVISHGPPHFRGRRKEEVCRSQSVPFHGGKPCVVRSSRYGLRGVRIGEVSHPAEIASQMSRIKGRGCGCLFR